LNSLLNVRGQRNIVLSGRWPIQDVAGIKRALLKTQLLTYYYQTMDSRLEGQKYISLATFRKSGAAVQTPVWFVEENGVTYIYSLPEAGKVKRIRNNPRVRIAACDMRGKVKGEWIEGKARVLGSKEAEIGNEALIRKYGWMKRVGDFFSKLRKRGRAVIAIELEPGQVP
jgi:PPOX class probable F420-dependent enzyme